MYLLAQKRKLSSSQKYSPSCFFSAFFLQSLRNFALDLLVCPWFAACMMNVNNPCVISKVFIRSGLCIYKRFHQVCRAGNNFITNFWQFHPEWLSNLQGNLAFYMFSFKISIWKLKRNWSYIVCSFREMVNDKKTEQRLTILLLPRGMARWYINAYSKQTYKVTILLTAKTREKASNRVLGSPRSFVIG